MAQSKASGAVQAPGLGLFIVVSPVCHDGKLYKPGETIELPEDGARQLLSFGSISLPEKPAAEPAPGDPDAVPE